MPKDLEKSDVAVEDGQYVLRPQDKSELKRNDLTEDDVPKYRIRIKLRDEQKERLTKQFQEEFRALLSERQNLGLSSKWSSLDRQYDGIMKKNAKLSFNLHTHQSKIKTDAIVRALNEAFLDSQPMVDVSPRPEFWKKENKSGEDICEKQQQFIQYEFEENIKPSADITRVGLCAVKKFVGIMKLEWCYEKELRKREETYIGENEIIGVNPDGTPATENKALKEFEDNYPNWQERGYKSYHDKIANGGTVNLVVEYLDTICNSAKWRHVSIEDFYVRNSTFYNEGLKKAHLIVERDTMTYWELMKKEKNEEFENVDDIVQMYPSASMSQGGTKIDYKNNDYPILEATIYFNLEEDDEEETKIKAWFAEIDSEQEKQTDGQKYELYGAILYPYYGFDIDYKAFYVKLNNDGFYGGAKSVMWDLKDSNIAQDAILNLSLHSMYIRNILTPIVKEGSEIEAMFIENRWQDGRPLPVDAMTEDVKDAMAFVEYPQINLQDFIVLGQQMQKIDSDVSGISGLMTGRESASDPHAPASKTIALLNQSGINIKDYIRTFLPAFNEMVGDTLQLYYQMSQEGKKFRVSYKSRKVTGEDAFSSITRDEMIARTNIQARASAFAFDKSSEKQENIMGYQMLASSPVAATQPEAYYKALKLALSSISPLWKNFTETDMLSPSEFQQKQMVVAMNALKKLLMGQFQTEQATGVKQLPPNAQQAGAVVTQAQAESANPALAEHQKDEAEKGNK